MLYGFPSDSSDTDHRDWMACVSTARDAALTSCTSGLELPLSQATSFIVPCNCDGFDINYSCAKTYCPSDTSLQSQYSNSYSNCTSFFSNPLAIPTTTNTKQVSQQTTGNTLIPASTTTSVDSSTSSTAGTTSAPDISSVATNQATSTTSTSKARADPAFASNSGLGGLVAFMAGVAALL
ncbi:hypothetical protein GQ53DRAFT_744923 [Thozetella sp. PMI_491]|nr:hypothetical protein GQ53DRAFT_744923 [Thozetella sp. PMI_491]